jgi:hypothetical protein
MVSTPLNQVAYAVEIPLMGLALGTVILRVWSRFAMKGRLATDDTLILLGTVGESTKTAFRMRADEVTQGCAIARTVISCISADDIMGYDRRG